MPGVVLSNGIKSYEYDFKTSKKHKKGVQPIRVDFFYICSPTTNIQYMVECEVYSYKMIVIKFSLKKPASRKLRFNTLTNHGEARPVINTCFRIFVQQYYSKDDQYSLAFIGANTVENTYTELKQETKRWRVYCDLAIKYLSQEKFLHIPNPNISAGIILNKKALVNNPNLSKDILHLFSETYLGTIFN